MEGWRGEGERRGSGRSRGEVGDERERGRKVGGGDGRRGEARGRGMGEVVNWEQ